MHAAPKGRSSTGAAPAQEQDIAIEALAWLAGEPARLERFLAISGLGPQNLRRAAAEPGFLGAVLDYLAQNEALMIEFAGHSGRAPETIARAHARLVAQEPGDAP